MVRHIRANRERHRRELQERSALAYSQACFTGRVFAGGGKPLPEVWEAFPFWTEEETRELQVEKYKAIMRQYVATGGASLAQSGS